MLNNVFRYGAIIQRIVDIFASARFIGGVVDRHIDNNILTVVNFFFLNSDKRT
ncbi:Uncharacterised protein [Shigella sonnei]|nr:Uncharacterised protein [Shigella sonnei]